MSSRPLISVIVPTYGRSALLHDAITSVLEQTVTDWECLVVDDGDPVPVVVPEDERVSVIRRGRNRGTAAARNTGLRAARGRYVSFLDDDDLYTPDRLELGLAGVDAASVVVCWARFLDGRSRPGRRLDGKVGDCLFEGLVPNMGQVMVRRDLVPHFDERLRCCEDVEWWVRTSQALDVTTIPQWGLLYRRHDGIRHQKSAANRAQARMQIMEWHEEFFASRPRSAAFQWRRIGATLASSGDRRAARAAFARSLRLHPRPSTLARLVRSTRPTRSLREVDA